MTARTPDRQDPIQIIARFVRGNWDLPETVATGLIEELASEGWIIANAQVFADMLAVLKMLTIASRAQLVGAELWNEVDAAIARAEGRQAEGVE